MTTRIWVDAQAVQSPHYERGIPRYVSALIRALHRQPVEVAGVALNPAQPLPAEPHRHLLGLPTATWATAAAFRAALDAGPLAYVQASPFEGMRPAQNLWPPFVLASGVPLATILYDTIPFRDPAYLRTAEDRAFHATRAELVRRADLVLAISEATAADAVTDLGLDPARVVTIGSGVDAGFGPADDGGAADGALLAERWPELREPFVFSVCGWMERKNTDGLLAAWARVPAATRADHRLVITCALKPGVLEAWHEQAARLGIADEVRFTGAVTEAELLALYRRAALFVYPSRYEGFGLPVAEAIACGTPAISSNTSSIPEVVGWAAGMFDPDDHEAMAALIDRGLTDAAFRSELVDACLAATGRHTWDGVAGRLVAALGTLAGSGVEGSGVDGWAGDGTRGRHRRPRVALVAADVDAALGDVAAALGPDVELDGFTGSTGPLAQPHDADRRCLPLAAFGTTFEPTSYDVVVYAFGVGAPELDVDVLRLALDHPGVVHLAGGADLAAVHVAWAHRQAADAVPTNAVPTNAVPTNAGADAAAAMRALLRDQYGDRVHGSFVHGDPLQPDALVRLGALCTAAVARRSRVVVVGDETEAGLVRFDAGPAGPEPDVRVGSLVDVVVGLLPR